MVTNSKFAWTAYLVLLQVVVAPYSSGVNDNVVVVTGRRR